MTSDDFARQIIDMTQTLYRVAYSQLQQPCDREDAVQECLRKAWEKRGMLRDERLLRTWLIRILINECHNIQKAGKCSVPVEDMEAYAGVGEIGDDSLRAALLTLDEKTRMPILLHYIEGYPVNEVAQMLRLPQDTVKSRMRRGRIQLRELLSEEVFS